MIPFLTSHSKICSSVQYLESQIIPLVYIVHTSLPSSQHLPALYIPTILWFLCSPTGVWTLCFNRKCRSFSSMFAWFHTTLLSLLWTDSMSGVPSIPVMPKFHSTSDCFDVPLRYQDLVSKWMLSYWVLQKETTWAARRVSLWSQDHPLGGVFLRSLAAWIWVSASFSITKQAPNTAFSQGCCQETHAFVTFLDVFGFFSDFNSDLCFCFDLFFYFFFQQSTIPIQQVSSKTFVLMLWMQCTLAKCSSRSGKTSCRNTQLTLSIFFPSKEDEITYTKASSKYCHLLYLALLPGDLCQEYSSHSHLISLWWDRLWSWTPTPMPQHKQSTSNKRVTKCSPKHLCWGIFPILFWPGLIPLGISACLCGAVSCSDLLANCLSTVPFFFPFSVVTIKLLIYLLVILGKMQACLYWASRLPIDFESIIHNI